MPPAASFGPAGKFGRPGKPGKLGAEKLGSEKPPPDSLAGVSGLGGLGAFGSLWKSCREHQNFLQLCAHDAHSDVPQSPASDDARFLSPAGSADNDAQYWPNLSGERVTSANRSARICPAVPV